MTPARTIQDLARRGLLQQARQAGEQAIADDPADDEALQALVDVYLDIESRCIQSGETSYLHEIDERLDTLIASMRSDSLKTGERHRRLQISMLPGYERLSELEQLSAGDGNEEKAYREAHDVIYSGNTPPALLDIYATIIYRYARVTMTLAEARPVKQLLFEYLGLPTRRPSRTHSLFLRLAIRCARKYPDFNFTRFFDIWNPRSLRDEDITDPDNKYPLAAAAMELVIDSDSAHEFPDMLRRIKASPDRRLSIVRQAWVSLVSRNIKTGDNTRAVDLLALYARTPSLHSADTYHSRLLSLALKVMDNDDIYHFPDFLTGWNTSLFMEDDFMAVTASDGTPVKPLTSRAFSRLFAALQADLPRHQHLLPQLLESIDKAQHVAPLPADELFTRRRAQLLLWMERGDEAVERMARIAADSNPSPSFWLDFAAMIPSRTLKKSILALGLLRSSCTDTTSLIPLRLSLSRLLHADGDDDSAATELRACDCAAEPSAQYRAIKSLLSPDASPGHDNERLYHLLAADALALVYRHIKSETYTVLSHEDRDITLVSSCTTPLHVDTTLWPLLTKSRPGDTIEIKRNVTDILMARPCQQIAPYANLTIHYAIKNSIDTLICADMPRPLHFDPDRTNPRDTVTVRLYLDVEYNWQPVDIHPAPPSEVLPRFPHINAAVYLANGDEKKLTAGPAGPNFVITDRSLTFSQICSVTYYRDNRGKAIAIATTQTPDDTDSDAIKTFSGQVRINHDGTATLTRTSERVTIDNDLISQSGIDDGTYVRTPAIYNPDTKSWHAISLHPYQ